MPGFELAPEHQVWELWAEWQGTNVQLHASRWSFVTLRELGTNQHDLWERWDTYCRPHFIDWRPADWQLKRVIVKDVYPGLQADWEHVYPNTLYGDNAAEESTAGAVTPLVIWKTEYPGRAYTGRTYWGPIREDQTLQDLIESETFNSMVFFCSAMTTYFNMHAALFPHLSAFCIVSHRLDGEPRIPPWVSGVDYAILMRFVRINRKRGNRDPLSEVAV